MMRAAWTLLAAALLAGTAVAQDAFVYPVWRPTPDAPNPWPKDVKGRDLKGRVVVACTVTATGTFDACRIESETPEGHGFGASVLESARHWRAEPVRVDGRPAASAVRFPIERTPFDTPPNWTRQPNVEQLNAAWPYEAGKRGQGGRALVHCEVSPEGGLRKCTAISEDPAGQGFGVAALSLTPSFRFKPAMLDGKPVASWVTVPITFRMQGSGGSGLEGRRIVTLTKPLWIAAPSVAQVDGAYPSRAGGQRGAASLECTVAEDGRLRDCETLSEEPRGKGFGGAARRLADRFQLAPFDAAASEVVNGARVKVKIPFQFDPPTAAGSGDLGGVRMLQNPSWSRMPAADRVEASFPNAAREKALREGRARLSCMVGEGGVLVGCAVVSEDPIGLGFGASALTLANGFQLAPWTEDGKPVVGSSIRIPIRFVDGDAAAAGASGGGTP